MRQLRYQAIAEHLKDRLTAGEFPAGALLPSEAELSRLHQVSRVTVRRALEVLREAGLVQSRQGFGWFAVGVPVEQGLARLDTIEAQLAEAGLRSERRILDFGFVVPPAPVAASLGADQVLRVRRVNLADGIPFARVTVWCAPRWGRGLSRTDVERASFLEQLPVSLGGATQVIGADGASSEDAQLLGIPAGSPVLVAERVTRSAAGEVVLVSEHVFAAHRTRFVVELPVDDGALSPTGVRLL